MDSQDFLGLSIGVLGNYKDTDKIFMKGHSKNYRLLIDKKAIH